MKPGDSAEITKTIEQADVDAFADLTGDHNPVHVDEEFAKTTHFGRRIAHGMLTASLISSVLANKLPGKGSVYLGQTLKFVAPVFPGDTITARVTVKEIRADKPIVKLETICINQHDEIVIRGEATVLATDRRG
ncbi:MAG TPA: MaoC family dehydratase [Pyrinomonadaceae bacterium]|jgi:acyl dehydratase|nr:MaoC family dehydratase [Pyrinomonadaceae bacterium]